MFIRLILLRDRETFVKLTRARDILQKALHNGWSLYLSFFEFVIHVAVHLPEDLKIIVSSCLIMYVKLTIPPPHKKKTK